MKPKPYTYRTAKGSETFIKCPFCNNPKCEECADEVDIGVGIQKHVFGFDCPNCGQLTVCPGCGEIENPKAKETKHQVWCAVKGD